MIYNINYDVCAMLISLFAIIFIILRKGFRQKQNIILFILFCVTLMAAFFDIVTSVANSYPEQWTDLSRYGCNYCYLGLQNVMPYLVCCYVVYITGMPYRKGKEEVIRLFLKLAIPWMVCIVLLFTNVFTHFVFYFDENVVYRHGAGINILYGIAFFYLAYSYYILIRYGHQAVRTTKIIIMILEIATVASVIAQIMFPSLLLQLCVEALSLLGLLVTVENENEIVDQVTTCYNRQRFIRDCMLGLESQANFEIILIRILNLGAYNASIGIADVNRVLHNLGLWLRSVDKKSDCYYCDGGCFAIICDKSIDSKTLEPILTARFQENFVSGKTSLRFHQQINHIRAFEEFKNLDQLLFLIGGTDQQSVNLLTDDTSAVKIDDYKNELVMQHAIERALKFDEFDVMYQPIWDARNNMITGAEALVRLYDDAEDLIPPESFISFAERRGYIAEIGERVFESACRFIATHDLDRVGLQQIHINLSPYQCMNEMMPDRFEEVREKYQIPVEKIVFEMSESNVVDNFEIVEKTVKNLHDKGYRFALDNYGKGTMDMAYLYHLPFSILKLDKYFLWKAEDNIKANIFFSGTMRMAKEMNMKTVVLGVEEAAQKTLLQNYDCDYLQGFYYQKAIPAEQFYRYCIGFNSKE